MVFGAQTVAALGTAEDGQQLTVGKLCKSDAGTAASGLWTVDGVEFQTKRPRSGVPAEDWGQLQRSQMVIDEIGQRNREEHR